MRKILILIAVLSILTVFAETYDELIRVGDYFIKRGEFVDAEKNYLKAVELSPNDAEILWRLGAVYNRIGMKLHDKARNDTLRLANSYLTKALRQNRNIAEIHSEMAWNLTYMGLLHDSWEDYALGGRIKEELDFALELDSKLADAHFMYGLWHRQVSRVSILKRKPHGLGDASPGEALKEFKKAVQLDSDRAQFWLELAVQQIENDDTSAAIKSLRRVKNTTSIPLNKQYMERAEEVLLQLENRPASKPEENEDN